jgi:sulfide:quinone oxidoreductase
MARRKTAWFRTEPMATEETVEVEFDMIHVVPPQTAPDFMRVSPLADAAGWVDVDQNTLRHKTVRQHLVARRRDERAERQDRRRSAQAGAGIVANNVMADMPAKPMAWPIYDGYGSCPLTVEKGKIVLAEFGYGGKLLPSSRAG